MRKLIAIVVLLCGAASVDAQTIDPSWCIKFTEHGGMSLVKKAIGKAYKLKLVSKHKGDEVYSEETEIWATDDRRFSVGLAEGLAYLSRNGEQGEVIIEDCP